MFQLNAQEFASLRWQIETSKSRGGRRYLPYAFTQEGVLRRPRAVTVNTEIMRAFYRMRGMLLSVDELARKVEALDRKAVANDQDMEDVFAALKELMTPTESPRREIGFHARPENKSPGAKRGRIRERNLSD